MKTAFPILWISSEILFTATSSGSPSGWSLVSTAMSLVLGYPTAFYMARTKSRMKQVMMIVILFPFLVSAVVRSYGWMVILGTNGLLNQLLQSLGLISAPLKILNTETAVIIGMIHLLVPYMVLSLVGVLQSIDPNVEYAAYSLGASPLQTFSKVVFPLSLPGLSLAAFWCSL